MTQDQPKTTATPTTTTPTTAPKSPAPKAARKLSAVVGARNPDNDAILAEIAGKPVVLTACDSEQRQGKRRKYWITNVTLDDERTFTVIGGGVAKPLSYLEPEDFPIEVIFQQAPSDFDPGAFYWEVV